MRDDTFGLRACQSRTLAMLHAPRNTRRHTNAKLLIVAGIVATVAYAGIAIYPSVRVLAGQ